MERLEIREISKNEMYTRVSAAGMCYSNVYESMNKLYAISMPDNSSNCPIKPRNDVTTRRRCNFVREHAFTNLMSTINMFHRLYCRFPSE